MQAFFFFFIEILSLQFGLVVWSQPNRKMLSKLSEDVPSFTSSHIARNTTSGSLESITFVLRLDDAAVVDLHVTDGRLVGKKNLDAKWIWSPTNEKVKRFQYLVLMTITATTNVASNNDIKL